MIRNMLLGEKKNADKGCFTWYDFFYVYYVCTYSIGTRYLAGTSIPGMFSFETHEKKRRTGLADGLGGHGGCYDLSL